MAPTLVQDVSATHAKQGLANLLKAREAQLSALAEKFWTIIGFGSIGAKAEELLRKTWAIERAGFDVNPRTVLAMGFFEAFKERRGINAALARGASSEELQQLVREGQFDEPEMKTFRRLVKQIHRDFRGIPLVVRSSAHGDCRGTGVYDSEFCINLNDEVKTLDDLAKAVKAVMISEFSESAIAFRKDLGLPEGVAVILEPVFGQRFKKHPDSGIIRFGPKYGGFGYTSGTDGGYVFFAAGLPTTAVKGKGIKVKESDSRTPSGIQDDEEERLSTGLHYRKLPDYLSDGTFLYVTKKDFDTASVALGTVAFNRLDWLFAKLKKLEQLTGKPQYVEFAIVEKDGQVHVTILQIADADQRPIKDEKEIVETERIVIRSGYVKGSGEVESDTILFVQKEDDIRLLRKLNQGLTDFVVVYVGDMIKSIQDNPLQYADISNARVIVETPNDSGKINHSDAPEGHFGGLLDTTKKIYMIGVDIDWQRLGRPEVVQDEYGGKVLVFHQKVRITASEKQQKAVVEIVE